MKKENQNLNDNDEVKKGVENTENEVTTEPTVNSEESSEEAADKIAADFEGLNQEVSDLKDKNLRLMAEFDNFRRRSLKERSELIKTAGESILSNILPLVDDFERAMKAMDSSKDGEAIKEGVNLIYNKFIAFLIENGVKAIPTENEVFDTDLHEAITTFPAPTEELKGKIIECVSKGYTLNEKVIRFSKVVVGE